MRALVTLGTFDGLHRGHRALLRRLVRSARRRGLAPHVVLFSRPPRFFLRPESAMPLLTTEAERAKMIRNLGIGRVSVLRFDARMAGLSHERFFERYLLGRFKAGGVLVGPDFAFGKGRLGDTRWLRRACRSRGLHYEVLPLLRAGSRKISSTRLREHLLRGEVDAVARLSGRPYRVVGRVVRGRGLGAKLGFPTANLRVNEGKFLPRGVFQVRVEGAGLRRTRLGVCNVGSRPTVGGTPRVVVEVHLPGFRGNLYGRELGVEFLRRLRGERKFSSLQALAAQIARDVRRAGRPLTPSGPASRPP